MNWSNLKNNKCPSCNKDLAKADYNLKWKKIICPCGFKISERKMAEIVRKMQQNKYKETFRDEEKNLNALQNL